MSGVEEVRGGGLWTSTGVILVLFILLVIITRTVFL
ncbi:sporulation protein YjcZ [Paenibacillus sp. DYY-L-2]